MGEGGLWNVHFTNKAYLVKLSTKGGGQKSPKNVPHGLCMAPNIKFINFWIFGDFSLSLVFLKKFKIE